MNEEPFTINVKIEPMSGNYDDYYRSSLPKAPLLKRIIIDVDSLSIAERTVYWFYFGKKIEQTAEELHKLVIGYRKELKYE